MRTIIPCAGNGTRFASDTPKPLLKLGDETVLDRILSRINTPSVIIVNETNKKKFGDYSVHSTGKEKGQGCLKDIWDYVRNTPLQDTLIVVGDIVFDFYLHSSLFRNKTHIIVPIISLPPEPRGEPVEIDNDNKVVRFGRGYYYELGIYYIPWELLPIIGRCVHTFDSDRPCSLIEYAYNKVPVYGLPIQNRYWYHIVTERDYENVSSKV